MSHAHLHISEIAVPHRCSCGDPPTILPTPRGYVVTCLTGCYLTSLPQPTRAAALRTWEELCAVMSEIVTWRDRCRTCDGDREITTSPTCEGVPCPACCADAEDL